MLGGAEVLDCAELVVGHAVHAFGLARLGVGHAEEVASVLLGPALDGTGFGDDHAALDVGLATRAGVVGLDDLSCAPRRRLCLARQPCCRRCLRGA